MIRCALNFIGETLCRGDHVPREPKCFATRRSVCVLIVDGEPGGEQADGRSSRCGGPNLGVSGYCKSEHGLNEDRRRSRRVPRDAGCSRAGRGRGHVAPGLSWSPSGTPPRSPRILADLFRIAGPLPGTFPRKRQRFSTSRITLAPIPPSVVKSCISSMDTSLARRHR